MKTVFKRLVSIMLVIVMIFGAAPLSGFKGLDLLEFNLIQKAEAAINGTCGDNLTWSFDHSTGMLTISGAGKITDYGSTSSVPWESNRSHIKSVNISNGVTSIGSYAFYGCTSLTSVMIPESVTNIGHDAFKYCNNIESITIPKGVTNIGEYAFSECSSLLDITISDSVTNISDGVFANCTSLANIIVDNNNRYYSSDSYGVLYNKSKTILIKYPAGNTRTHYLIPEGVTGIGKSAFSDCNYLADITIPNSVINIESGTFSGCYSLTTITVDRNNEYFSSDENGVLFNKEKTLLIKYPMGNVRTSYTIPDSVKDIKSYAFSGCVNLSDLIIQNDVTSIGDSAFFDCTSLTSITIPDSVTSIGNYAFYDCIGLTNIIIPQSIKSIGNYAFYGCHNLKTITIPDGIAIINDSAFRDCSSLKAVIIPDNVTRIDHSAFSGCTNLTSIIIPDSVTSIGSYAFYGCTNLTNITIPDSVTSIDGHVFSNTAYYNNKKNWEDGILYIDGHLIVAQTDISGSCEIKSTTKVVAASAFFGCSNISNIIIPEGITNIGDYTFYNCKSLVHVTIPESVTSIGKYAFQNCNSLAIITMADNVTNIGCEAFYNTAYYNNEMNWENGVLYIGNHLIKAKTDVSGSYEVKAGTKTLADESFEYCSCLTNIAIPNSVVSIGNYAFNGCKKLVNVNIPNRITVINDRVFAGCSNLESINIPTGVKVIGEGAFWNCDGLESIIIPHTVTYIGETAFCECDGIVSMQIPEGITIISDSMFAVSWNLSSVIIPDSITTIEDSAFYYCGSLTDVFYAGSEEEWERITVGSKNEDLINATIHYNYNVPSSGDDSGYIDKNKTSEIEQQYINEHINFVKSNNYNNLVTNASFYNQIWQYEESSRNFTRYSAWDVIGDVGKAFVFDFKGAFSTENPYDVILVDIFRDYANKSEKGWITSAKNNAKYILGAADVYNNLLDVFKTSEAWSEDLAEPLAKFTEYIQDNWLDGVFFDSNSFDLDNYDKTLYNELEKVISGLSESKINKFFGGLSNTGTIIDYITNGGDIVYRFFDAYQKYLIAQAVYESNAELLAVLQTTADNLMSGNASTLLSEALKPYWVAFNYDNSFSAVCKIMLEDGVCGAAGNVAYNLLLKGSIREFTYGTISAITGISAGALVATYNLTYMCLDWMSGLGKQSEAHKLMNAAALLEKQMVNLVKNNASTLTSNKSFNNAKRFDMLWGFLQSIEAYCYKTMASYASALKKEYQLDYNIETSLADNKIYTLIRKIQLKEELASCDAAIQTVVYLENEWNKYNCHSVSYEPSKMITVKCPTDVFVYDSKETLVLSIVDNEITLCTDNITAFVDGDEKIIVLPTIQEYDVKITATDDGSMDYGIKSFDELELIRVVTYDSVDLYENKSYYGSIPAEQFVSVTDYDLISELGERKNASRDVYDSAMFDFKILAPSTTTISYGDAIILHANLAETLPAGWKIEWTASNDNFSYSASKDGTTCKISPDSKGDTTFTVSVVDSNGNVISSDEQTMTSKAGFFDKIIAFFKKLFGLTKTIPQVFKGVF